MDKKSEEIYDGLLGVRLECIESGVKNNGYSIADNSLRLMKIDDDIAELKKLGEEQKKSSAEIHKNLAVLIEMQEKSLTVQELERIRSLSQGELLAEIKENQIDIKRQLAKLDVNTNYGIDKMSEEEIHKLWKSEVGAI